MKKIELLIPVGNKDSLPQAIHNGADAVYLAGKNYGARSYADNFTEEELIEVVKYSHLYGVKVYITTNTIIFNNEINEFLKYISFLNDISVDAVIMQDIGMITKVREMFPNLEVHASTQMHNHNEYGIKLLEEIGVKRVVYARELSLDEITNIKSNIEKEVFVHGAICVCYSGCCLFSARTSNRSGNRGQCVASCRLRYKLQQNNKTINAPGEYLLSTKELNNIENIPQIIDSGVNSIKIEGRMKSPEYVGFITKIYREAIDNYYENKIYNISAEISKNMKTLFNREFTKGYLFNEYGSKLMNIKTPNHQGSKLGKVTYVDSKIIKIYLYEDLNQEDALRFVNSNSGMIINKLYNEKGLLVNKIEKGNIAVIDNKINLNEKDIVNKTIDKVLLNSIRNYLEKKIKIDIDIKAFIGKPLEINIKDGINTIIKTGVLVDKSLNRPMSKEDIIKQVTKLGGTPFIVNNINILKDDEIFISNKDINELRRTVIDELIDKRRNSVNQKENKKYTFEHKNIIKEKNNINVLIRTQEQLDACIKSNIDNIYITNYELYKKYKENNKNIYYVLDRVTKNNINYENENLLVRELGGVEKYPKNNNVVCDYTLNISNKESAYFIASKGVNRVCYSIEENITDIENININTEVLVYGKVELMITKYCILNMLLNDNNKKCSLCKTNDKYCLLDEKSNKYILKHDKCITTIYDKENIDLSDKVKYLKNKVNNIRINLLDENYNETINIINKFRGLYE